MASTIEEILEAMKRNPKGIRFADACKVADHFFGQPTQKGSSHRVWKMPWPGNQRVNMRNDKGDAKAYQVRQLLEAVERCANQAVAEAREVAAPVSEKAKRKKRKLK
jgi:hypothetical protein